jgi:hypothetical protein
MPADNFQAEFQRRRGHLTDSHVRALAWLLDAPDLLDPLAAQWQGRIATLFDHQGTEIDAWLLELDRDPAPLLAYIDAHPSNRLGRYAERLMAFFFRHQGILCAHGVQVRAGKNDTVGEFDFLLWRGAPLQADGRRALLHWEFATKFYLLESSGAGRDADYLVGPNLADTLGAKMRKILDRQLSLSSHPAAQVHLPQTVDSAQALIKGWLFYPLGQPQPALSLGVSAAHCRGFWATLAEAEYLPGERYLILPRLSWLAPARAASDACIGRLDLRETLNAHFATDTLPLLVAVMRVQVQDRDVAVETGRGFIVPNDWRGRARERVQGR